MSGKVFAYEVVVYIYYTILHNHISSADEVWKKKFKLPKLKTFKRTIAKTTLWMCITDFIILRKYSFEFLSKFWKTLHISISNELAHWQRNVHFTEII